LLSLPGLTGQASNHGRCLPDRPVKPGDDSRAGISFIEKRMTAGAARNDT